VKNSKNPKRRCFAFASMLTLFLAALVLGSGCATRIPDPLLGWKRADYLAEPNETIVKDYQDYIQKLPPEEKKFAYVNHFFEDGTGQHAVQIKIPLHGTWWEHVLIYDKDNKRVKTIKFSRGGYGS
jgi:hypothetical protein